MSKLMLPQGFYFSDNNGNPLTGGKVYISSSATTIPKVTYADMEGTIENTNPIILPSNGRCYIYGDAGDVYRLRIFDSNDIIIENGDYEVMLPPISGETEEARYLRADCNVSRPCVDIGNGILGDRTSTSENTGDFTFSDAGIRKSVIIPSDGLYVYSLAFSISCTTSITDYSEVNFDLIITRNGVHETYTINTASFQENTTGTVDRVFVASLRLKESDEVWVKLSSITEGAKTNFTLNGWHLTICSVPNTVASNIVGGGGGDIAPVSDNLSLVSANLASVSGNLNSVSNTLNTVYGNLSNVSSGLINVSSGLIVTNSILSAVSSAVGSAGGTIYNTFSYFEDFANLSGVSTASPYNKYNLHTITSIDSRLAVLNRLSNADAKNRLGILGVTAMGGATNNSASQIRGATSYYFDGGAFTWECALQVTKASGTMKQFVIGMTDWDGTDSSHYYASSSNKNSLFFIFLSDGRILCNIQQYIHNQEVTASVGLTFGQFYKLKIQSNTNGTIWNYYIDDVLVGTITAFTDGSPVFPKSSKGTYYDFLCFYDNSATYTSVDIDYIQATKVISR